MDISFIRNNKGCALIGTKNQLTTQATTKQPLLQKFVFHVHQPPYLCSFATIHARIGVTDEMGVSSKGPRSKKLLNCVSYIGQEQKCGPKEFTLGYVFKV